MDRAIKELEDKIEYCKRQAESLTSDRDRTMRYYYEGQINAFEYAIQVVKICCK